MPAASALAGVPVNLLDVVRRHGQRMTAASTAALENDAAALGRHTLAETMDTGAATDLRLIGTLGRHIEILTLESMRGSSI
jgi:hypothetical protein